MQIFPHFFVENLDCDLWSVICDQWTDMCELWSVIGEVWCVISVLWCVMCYLWGVVFFLGVALFDWLLSNGLYVAFLRNAEQVCILPHTALPSVAQCGDNRMACLRHAVCYYVLWFPFSFSRQPRLWALCLRCELFLILLYIPFGSASWSEVRAKLERRQSEGRVGALLHQIVVWYRLR